MAHPGDCDGMPEGAGKDAQAVLLAERGRRRQPHSSASDSSRSACAAEGPHRPRRRNRWNPRTSSRATPASISPAARDCALTPSSSFDLRETLEHPSTSRRTSLEDPTDRRDHPLFVERKVTAGGPRRKPPSAFLAHQGMAATSGEGVDLRRTRCARSRSVPTSSGAVQSPGAASTFGIEKLEDSRISVVVLGFGVRRKPSSILNAFVAAPIVDATARLLR